jgi:hypothetical protein
MNVSNSMPIGPIGEQPVDHADGGVAGQPASQPRSVDAHPEQPAPAASSVSIATQLVQDARAAKKNGSSTSVTAPLGDLVNSVASQLGAGHLSEEQKQSIVARLADDPVVKSLIG